MIEDESNLKYNIDFFSFEQAYKQVSKPWKRDLILIHDAM